MNLKYIFKIIDVKEWQKVKQSETYLGYVQIKKFWKDHTKAIRQFHRYPHRNKILGRESTEEELAFLNGPNASW